MTKMLIDRQVVEHALHVAMAAEHPVKLIAALRAALAEPQVPVAWLRVIDEAMVTHHLGVADPGDDYETAKRKMNTLLSAAQDIGTYFAKQAEPVQDHFRDARKMVQEPGVWTPVTDALPQSGVKVLACYRNRLGNLRRIRAMWTAAKTEEASSEDAEACSEYDEATDTYYVTEGWYECIDNWGDYSSVAVTEGEVTHWMPLPPDPDSAPPQRPAKPQGCDHCNHPLYAATKCRVCGRVTEPTPPQRKPLAEWQINDLMADIDPEDRDSWSFRQGVYAAEKHHGVRK